MQTNNVSHCDLIRFTKISDVSLLDISRRTFEDKFIGSLDFFFQLGNASSVVVRVTCHVIVRKAEVSSSFLFKIFFIKDFQQVSKCILSSYYQF